MSDGTRRARSGPRRRIAGQRRPADRRPADPQEEDPTATPLSTAAHEPPIESPANTDESTPADSVAAVADAEEPARLGRLLTVMIAVLLVLTLSTAVVLGTRAWKGREAEQARPEAVAAASKAAELVLSYDHQSLDKDFAAARATLTPEFAADFDQTTKVVAEQARKTRATVKAEVREVGVRDGDADRVTLLVFVNQTTTSTITQGKPRVDLNRALFTMVRKGDRWLVQGIAGR